MRAELEKWIDEYPRQPGWRDGTYAGSRIASHLTHDVPEALRRTAQLSKSAYRVEGSAGAGDWTHTPWAAILDLSVTDTVQDGYYIVYLLSHGCDRLYLSLNQGCTRLKDSHGDRGAAVELSRRAEALRNRALPRAKRLTRLDMNLSTSSWRGRLYEHGSVLGVEYSTSSLPFEEDLKSDLLEAVDLYQHLRRSGGWQADDEIALEGLADGIDGDLEHLKRYKQHRAIERHNSHSKKVKKVLGDRCMACQRTMSERYGSLAAGLIEAHHLAPLSSLADDQIVRLNPRKDFAVLCPNCHRVIHRMEDPGNLEGLRQLVRNEPPTPPATPSRTPAATGSGSA